MLKVSKQVETKMEEGDKINYPLEYDEKKEGRNKLHAYKPSMCMDVEFHNSLIQLSFFETTKKVQALENAKRSCWSWCFHHPKK